jgi:hypothetical protein
MARWPSLSARRALVVVLLTTVLYAAAATVVAACGMTETLRQPGRKAQSAGVGSSRLSSSAGVLAAVASLLRVCLAGESAAGGTGLGGGTRAVSWPSARAAAGSAMRYASDTSQKVRAREKKGVLGLVYAGLIRAGGR